MSRRLAPVTAALAAAVALIPGLAYGADAPRAVTDTHVPSTARVTGTGSPVFKTFTSPASSSIRQQKRTAIAAMSPAAGTGKTIYATSTPFCTTETGTGTQASPFCLIQDAVNAAAPGDTINVLGSIGYFSYESVTVKTSGISIVGIGSQAWIGAVNASSGKPALILDHVTNVTVSNMMLTAYGSPSVEVMGSSGITLDSDYLNLGLGSKNTTGTLAIDGASSNVTVSRTYVDSGNQGGATGISVAAGASHVTLASDILAAAGITATGVSDLNIAGTTIQRGCAPGSTSRARRLRSASRTTSSRTRIRIRTT